MVPVLKTMDFQPFGQDRLHTQPGSWYLLPSRDPELKGAQKQGQGAIPKGSPWQNRWEDTEWRGAQCIWTKTDERQLPPGGGTREAFTKDMMGKMALKQFCDGERQLDQSPYQHVSKTPCSGLYCHHWLSSLPPPSDWELWKGIPLPGPSQPTSAPGGRKGGR